MSKPIAFWNWAVMGVWFAPRARPKFSSRKRPARVPRLESLSPRCLLAVDGYAIARSEIDAGIESFTLGEPVGAEFESRDPLQFKRMLEEGVDINTEFFTAFPGSALEYGGDAVNGSSVVVNTAGESFDRAESLIWNYLVYGAQNGDGTWGYAERYTASYDVGLTPHSTDLDPIAESGEFTYSIVVTSDGSVVTSTFSGTRSHHRSGDASPSSEELTATGTWWHDTDVSLTITATYDVATATLIERTAEELGTESQGFSVLGSYGYEITDGSIAGTFSESMSVAAGYHRSPESYSFDETAVYDRSFSGGGDYASIIPASTETGTLTESGGQQWNYQLAVSTVIAGEGVETIEAAS